MESVTMAGRCSICVDNFDSYSDICAVPCGHVFHQGCLAQWLNNRYSCPQCREFVTPLSVIPKLYFDAGPDQEPEEDDLESPTEIGPMASRQMIKNLKNELMALRSKLAFQTQRLAIEVELTSSLKIQLRNEEYECIMLRVQCAADNRESMIWHDKYNKLQGEMLETSGKINQLKAKLESKQLEDKNLHQELERLQEKEYFRKIAMLGGIILWCAIRVAQIMCKRNLGI